MIHSYLNTIKIVFFTLFLILNYHLVISADYSYCGRFIIDGYFNDWNSTASIDDKIGDANGKLDILQMKVGNDEKYVYFYVKFDSTINLQENNNITLYIDNDNSATTGEQINGIGADLVWHFGQRFGNFYVKKNKYFLKHSSIELVSLPSVNSNEFEIALPIDKTVYGNKIFPQSQFRFALTTDTLGGDVIPDNGEFINFTISYCDQIPLQIINIEKENTAFIRISAWNCLQDSISNPNLKGQFERIFKTINPDMMGLEELYTTDETYVTKLFNEAIPGTAFHIKKQPYTDIVLVSRYPILASKQINGNAAFLIDMQEQFHTNALVIVVHLPASQNNDSRLKEILDIVNFIYKAKNKQIWSNLEINSPIFVIGDMNFVGLKEQLDTMLSGIYQGSGSWNDWDNTAFAEANPRLTEEPFCYSWINNLSYYGPGKLDYIFYSDYVSDLKKSFVIYTTKMSNTAISKYGLNYDDSPKASDHCPIVADFQLKNISDVETNNEQTQQFKIENNAIVLKQNSNSFVVIYNILGQIVKQKQVKDIEQIDISYLKQGIYFIVIVDNQLNMQIKSYFIKNY